MICKIVIVVATLGTTKGTLPAGYVAWQHIEGGSSVSTDENSIVRIEKV